MSSLVPCPSCSRHVRAAETACPFCANALPSDMGARAVPASPRRLERLAAFTFAATLAVTGCSAGGGEETEQQEGEIGSIMPMYGMPAPVEDAGPGPDGGEDCTKAADAGAPDPGSIMPMYGAPPPWESTPAPCDGDKDGDKDGGSIMPMYGMPAD